MAHANNHCISNNFHLFWIRPFTATKGGCLVAIILGGCMDDCQEIDVLLRRNWIFILSQIILLQHSFIWKQINDFSAHCTLVAVSWKQIADGISPSRMLSWLPQKTDAYILVLAAGTPQNSETTNSANKTQSPPQSEINILLLLQTSHRNKHLS